MHTDEYEISLLKEVAVCDQYIRTLQKTLEQLERKYRLSSEAVVNARSGFSTQIDGRDHARWLEAHDALISWRNRKAEYEELHRQMKK